MPKQFRSRHWGEEGTVNHTQAVKEEPHRSEWNLIQANATTPGEVLLSLTKKNPGKLTFFCSAHLTLKKTKFENLIL